MAKDGWHSTVAVLRDSFECNVVTENSWKQIWIAQDTHLLECGKYFLSPTRRQSITIGGATGQLLEQHAQALDQISVNFPALKVVIRRS
ncbi:hypothetical protein LguiA_002580 [Lonicera macranthoides]